MDNSIENLPDLITQIKAKVYKNLIPQVEESFAYGNPISFGKLSIQKNYLQINYKNKPDRIPWTELNSISIDSGKLKIAKKNHKEYHIMISDIDNLEILINIIKHRV